MQTLNCYYYPNAVVVQLNADPTLKLRNRVMYQRTLRLYKGTDNIVRFTFKNSDQKPVNVTGWVVTFNMLSDEEGTLVLSKPVNTIDAVAGVVTINVTDLDLVDLNNEFYHYSLSVTDPDGIEQVVYADDNYGVRGEVTVESGHYPMFKPSIQVSLPTNSNTNVITSTVVADTQSRMQSAHHSAQFYFNEFSGNITVQTTLDSLPPNGNTSANTSLSWATVSNLPFVTQSVPSYYNWDGVYTAVRFIVTPDDAVIPNGTVTKILYRA